MQVSCLCNLIDCRVTDATCGVVDDTLQCLLIVGVYHHAEVSNDILDLLALVEAQSTIDTIGNALLSHVFLERTAL